MKGCPEFERLSRFHDGLIEPEIAGHLGECPLCAQTLADLDLVDGLIQLELPARPRLLKFRWIAAAAALLLGLGFGWLWTGPEPEPDLGLEDHPFASVWDKTAARHVDLQPGDAVVTSSGQKAKVDWKETELLINENSRVEIGSTETVNLVQGELYAIYVQPFEIRTSEGIAWVESGECRVTESSDATVLTVLKGRGEFRSAGETVRLEPGGELRLDRRSKKKDVRKGAKVDVAWADSVRQVLFQDRFTAAALSRPWKIGDARAGQVSIQEQTLTISLNAHPKKKSIQVGLGKPFPFSGAIEIEFNLRIPESVKGAAAQLVLQSGKSKLPCAWRSDEQAIGALWSQPAALDAEWHRILVVVTASDVITHRDGKLVARVPHGLGGVDRLGISWSAVSDRRFEFQISDLVVRRGEPR